MQDEGCGISLRTSRRREYVAAVALASFLLRALIPVGFMPAANGASPIILCSGWASTSTAADGDRSPHRGAHHDGDLCPFALAASFASPPEPPCNAQWAAAFDVFVPIDRISPPTALAGPPRAQSSRAPPALS